VDIGLARVSTRDQNPQLQIDALNKAGCWPIYEEKVSGVSKKRPVRDEVLQQLKPDDTLTVWKLDRLGRSVSELLDIIGDLADRGVRFRCLTQPIDTSSPTGRLFLTFLAGFAEFERELMRERVIAGKERMKAEGKHPGGSPLFGFEADHETINEEQAALVREASRRALDGESLSRVVDDFNARGHRPGKATHWRVTYLRRILINDRTAAIVGQEDHDKLVRLFTGRNRQKLGRPAEHLLSGILHCGREGCGRPMYGTWKMSRSGRREMYYRCKPGSGSGGRFQGCGSTGVAMTRADAWAAEAFIAAVCSEEFTDSLNRRRAELLAGEVTVAQVEEWRQEIDELELVLPTRFAADIHRQRHDELQRMVRQATAGLVQRPDLQALMELPRAEAELRAAWEEWTVPEQRVWLRRVLHHITVLPAPPGHHHRGSDVESRFDPKWRL
jgi:DNA invertase Pin-like site-specific DNA recombinase